MENYFQLLGRLISYGLLAYFLYRTFFRSDKPAALILMLGLMIIAEDYLQLAIYLPGLESGSVRFSEVIILFLLIKDYRKPRRYEKFESKAIDVLWIPYILFFLVSIFVSNHFFSAAKNFRWSIIGPFFIYLIGCYGFDEEEDYKRFVIYLGVLVLLLAAASIDDLKFDRLWFKSSMRFKYEYYGGATKGRYGSFFLNPNFFASFLVLALPLIIMSIAYFKRLKRYLLFLAVLGGLLALILTYTRAAYIAVFAGLLFSLNYGLFKVIKLRQIVFSVFITICLVALIFPGSFNKIINRADTIKYEGEESRTYIWINALQLVKQHPIIGIGLSESDYRDAATKFSGIDFEKMRHGIVVSGFMDQPHNSYISLALWVSPFAVIIFIWMNYKLLKLGRYIVRDSDTPEFYKLFSCGVGISITCYLVIIFFDTQLLLRSVNSLYWLIFGLLVSIYRRSKSVKRGKELDKALLGG